MNSPSNSTAYGSSLPKGHTGLFVGTILALHCMTKVT